MISETPFVVVDLETTGLEPKLDRIVEIAAVKVKNGVIIEEWDTLVNPGIFIPQITTDISGITSDMVKDSPRFDEVADEYLKFIGTDSVFVAHNVDFDWRFMNTHLQRHDREEMNNPNLCTFKLAKRVHPNLPAYGLGALTETFSIDLVQAHRALHDARATAELFLKFLRSLQGGGLKYVKDFPTIQNLPTEKKEQAEGQGSLF
ncbi:3'-5' exonuclease [Candidatus Peregrinibacteria bacterium]|jgi:DNA polymerase III epsilon subunit family exonuclease|nr:3'-5' exonuclease [Candidatus Peregrinibacteria bacterium]MBT4631559.1 3'-5' exonuclease [Candidatus Peregrinibacteria bacterium]MBT5517222.1 3'-5' exonuclease [Candidatus Peregrinibacteria bacterium]MBT5823544.1 3'-5' exonuclease [Candidatus Peregrinibacteria bacterium]